MTVFNLKVEHENHYPGSHFFDPETLRFFGQSLSRMSVLEKTATITDCRGKSHNCYVLSAAGKDFFGNKRRDYYYFDVTNYEYIVC